MVYTTIFSALRVKYVKVDTQQTPRIYPVFDQCWAYVVDGGPALVKHWVDVSCFLGINTSMNCIKPTPYSLKFNIPK